MKSKRDLDPEAIRIENDFLKEKVGSQDQFQAAYGGFNRINFSTDDTFAITSIIFGSITKNPTSELELWAREGRLLLFHPKRRNL